MNAKIARQITAIEIVLNEFIHFRNAKRLTRDILSKVRRSAKKGNVSIRADFHCMYLDYVTDALEKKDFEVIYHKRINELCFIEVRWGKDVGDDNGG